LSGFLEFSPKLASEATAEIEPAMKVLQTAAPIRGPDLRNPANFEKS